MTTYRIFLCGDVMLGRGIDQILAHPSQPRLYESHIGSAKTYVELAEVVNGRIPRHVPPAYVWGDALDVLHEMRPVRRIINLETAITTHFRPWPKGINYRMHPGNLDCLTIARIDCCVLANNHVLDWRRAGLQETLATLRCAGIHAAGAGDTEVEAAEPAILPLPAGGRIWVHGFASETSGVPPDWAAGTDRPGVNLLADLSVATAARVAKDARARGRPGDLLVASVHWGGNWGYDIPNTQREFAHALIDGGFHLVHGHSSHHAKGLEIHQGQLILYGCGDFLNDYEGIPGYEDFRNDLTVMYLPEFDSPSGRLLSLVLVPMRIRQFRLGHPSAEDVAWLYRTLARESGKLGTRIMLGADGRLEVAVSPQGQVISRI